MKDLGKPKYRSLLQLEHLHSCIMVYYVVYIQYILQKFIMDKSYPSIEKGLFRPKDDGNEILGLNVHNAIGSTKHNLLVLKNIFRYLQGIKQLVLVFFQFHINVNTDIIGYIDQIPTMSDRRQAQSSYQVSQPSHEESSKQTSRLHPPTIITTIMFLVLPGCKHVT